MIKSMKNNLSYQVDKIEKKWQCYWLKNQTFKAKDFSKKPKLYVLDMFPYPSGSGLHVGHPHGYTATDVYCRFQRMQGYNVLHPMGWDAFGLPAEQYALETGTHPAVTTKRNINTFRRQIQSLGFSYDWSREINTTDPSYYKWTQWIFCQLYKNGLAYIDEVTVNWCPSLGTVLANEEVIDGKSERGGYPVIRRPMRQWVLKITQYAESLLKGLDELDWPEGIKTMQRKWIGKSLGSNVKFSIVGQEEYIRVYTTRPDTLFGVTYMVLAPEHPLLEKICSNEQKKMVEQYREDTARKSDLDRTGLNQEKTGVFTGAYAINPVNAQRIPIWIADYVLASYGTGAIMAVPAHDKRDFAFARTFNLPIKAILQPEVEAAKKANIDIAILLQGKACWEGDGHLINSANEMGLSINGLHRAEASKRMSEWLEENGYGERAVNYKLRDWLFSRQRYWGEPFPVLHMGNDKVKLLDENELPLVLPELIDYKAIGTGESPLGRAKQWLDYTDPQTGEKSRRETHTMPQWAGSCWYYLRFLDPYNNDKAWDEEKEKYWMPVDLYVGGAEHAVLHLLYARFWHHVLYDLGLVSCKEPFKRLVNQGMILGTSYRDTQGALVPNDQVEAKGNKFFHKESGAILESFPAKMSKSLKNVVNPDEEIKQYGADSFRLYQLFMGPLEAVKPWQHSGIDGVHRFLNKAWRMIIGPDGKLASEISDTQMNESALRCLNQTIQKVSEDLATLNFNTAISQLMIFVNTFSSLSNRNRQDMGTFVLLLSPMAPHIAEELWERLGHEESLAYESWPQYNEQYLKMDTVEILVQVNGKAKTRMMLPSDSSKETMERRALEDPKIQAIISKHRVDKIICVPNRLVNIVSVSHAKNG